MLHDLIARHYPQPVGVCESGVAESTVNYENLTDCDNKIKELISAKHELEKVIFFKTISYKGNLFPTGYRCSEESEDPRDDPVARHQDLQGEVHD